MHSCKICNYITSSYCDLKRHYKTKKHINIIQQSNEIENQEAIKFVCSYCDRIYSYKYNLNKHIDKCKFKEVSNIKYNYTQQLRNRKTKN